MSGPGQRPRDHVGWSGVAKAPARSVPSGEESLRSKPQRENMPGQPQFSCVTTATDPRLPGRVAQRRPMDSLCPPPDAPEPPPAIRAGVCPRGKRASQPEHGLSHGARRGICRHRHPLALALHPSPGRQPCLGAGGTGRVPEWQRERNSAGGGTLVPWVGVGLRHPPSPVLLPDTEPAPDAPPRDATSWSLDL